MSIITPGRRRVYTPGGLILPPQLTLNQVFADDFNRANGPLAGSNGWVATGDGTAAITGNEAVGIGSALGGDYRPETFSGDQYVQCTVGTVNQVNNAFIGMVLRHNPTTNAEYGLLYFFNGSSPVFNFYYRFSAGAYTLINGVGLGGPLPVGTALQFHVIGNVLVGSINGTPQMALIDTHIPPGGSPGLITFGTMTMDGYRCGNASMGAALGAAIGTDNFNRADGSASAGQAGWTPVTASFSGVVSTDGTIVNNELNLSGTSGHHTAERNEVYNPDQWSLLGMGSTPPPTGSGAFVGVILRWNGTSGYMFCYFLNGASYRIYFIHIGTNSVQLASVQANPSVSNPTNTTYRGVAKGSRLAFWVNDCEVIAVTDTQATAGQPGYQCYPASTADNFAAGNV